MGGAIISTDTCRQTRTLTLASKLFRTTGMTRTCRTTSQTSLEQSLIRPQGNQLRWRPREHRVGLVGFMAWSVRSRDRVRRCH